MPKNIMDPYLYMVIITAILAVPALIFGFFVVGEMSTVPSIALTILSGLLMGGLRDRYFRDNVTLGVLSLPVLAFLMLFLTIPNYATALLFVLGVFIGIYTEKGH
ncbi:MAG: hypothetical protein MUP58_02035 [Candidatus Nanohaloarchaeota archaeon QJJ-9]|nr:hypothetical protein [Candidatus Nanohaloarchaeota archaeon QJJ-9]